MPLPLLSNAILSRRNIVVLGGCIGALLIFAGVALLPNIHKYRQQTKAIRHLQEQLNEQNDMNALYRKLEEKLASLAELDTAAPVKPEPLPAGEIGQIGLTLQELAHRKGVVLDEVRPAIESGSLPSHQVRIQAVLLGTLEQHRALLLDLLREPYVDEIERLAFEANGKDITLRIILAINIV